MRMEQTERLAVTAKAERTIFKNIYLWMTLGLALTGLVAWGVGHNPVLLRSLLGGPFNLLILVGLQLFLVYRISARVMDMSLPAAILSYAGYAVLNGITLSTIFIAYRLGTISTAFLTTAGTFAAVSIWAVVTDADLTKVGHYAFMGLIGIVIASLVNFFLRSPLMDYIISYAGVAIFIALTAYDTKKLKVMSSRMGDQIGEDDFIRLSIMGALILYLDFINLFIFILRILGNRRD